MTHPFDPVLGEAFGFDEADLIANRRLQLSLAQRGRLHDGADAHRRNVPRTLAILGVALAIVAAFSVWQVNGDWDQLLMPLVAGVPMVVFMVFIIRRNRAVADRMDAGHVWVQIADGVVTVADPGYDWSARQQRRLLAIRIADVEFLHEPEAAQAFQDGARYMVYWAEPWGNGMKAILSAERIP